MEWMVRFKSLQQIKKEPKFTLKAKWQNSRKLGKLKKIKNGLQKGCMDIYSYCYRQFLCPPRVINKFYYGTGNKNF